MDTTQATTLSNTLCKCVAFDIFVQFCIVPFDLIYFSIKSTQPMILYIPDFITFKISNQNKQFKAELAIAKFHTFQKWKKFHLENPKFRLLLMSYVQSKLYRFKKKVLHFIKILRFFETQPKGWATVRAKVRIILM